MLHGKRVIIVLPAYQAGQTLSQTVDAIPKGVADELILVDDSSSDETVEVAAQLRIRCVVHEHNLGYGANQKTCYREALSAGADIVVMLHPDYQYDPRLITAMGAMIASDAYDVILGSRILGGGALSGGMPVYKYIANRFLTAVQNLIMQTKISEFHTGYRAFSRQALLRLPLLANSDNFLFDNQILAQAKAFGLRIGEISCPTKYFPEASSIRFRQSVVYGLGVLETALSYRLWKWKLARPQIFRDSPEFRLVANG